MITLKTTADFTRLRRIALAAQGLLQAQPFGRAGLGALRTIEHLGYVQIDSISVVERAHHHVLQNRVPGYSPDMLLKLLADKAVFEYWSHAAAFLPMRDYRFSLPYKHAIKSGQIHWFKTPDARAMTQLLARIKTDGPLRSRDLDASPTTRTGWWDWKPAKKALEQLYMQGDLMVTARDGFQKTYDLTERVLPAGTQNQQPTTAEFAQHLVDQQLRSHGFASTKGMAYLRKVPGLRACIDAYVADNITQGTFEKLLLPNGTVFVAQKGVWEQVLPKVAARVHILSPFDPSVIQRQRLKDVFAFDYQIECYVPQPKRQYGYFCLPLLYKDQFIGRMDCKAQRKTHVLDVMSLHFEPQITMEDGLLDALTKTLHQFANMQACNTVNLLHTHPQPWLAELSRRLAHLA